MASAVVETIFSSRSCDKKWSIEVLRCEENADKVIASVYVAQKTHYKLPSQCGKAGEKMVNQNGVPSKVSNMGHK